MHNWARQAALASICTSFQGNDLFWRFHDFLFSRQSSITAENFSSSVTEFAALAPQFSQAQYET